MCVRGFAAFKAVFVFLPLVGGKTAFLLWAASGCLQVETLSTCKLGFGSKYSLLQTV
jgi:hypothetical protein